MKILKTPKENFAKLEGYSFKENYIEVGDNLNLHYLEEGPVDGEIVLLMHGEPSWSYLYRKMIPILTSAGYRTIAPDLIGFGKSDKPASREDYTYKRHINWLENFLVAKKLNKINLICQDWGGLLGLRLVTNNPDRFERIMAANTFLPTGEGNPPEAFLKWRDFASKVKSLPIGKIIQNGCISKLSPEVIRAYNAPFPSEEYKEGARIFPTLVPISEEIPESKNNREAWNVLKQWKKPFLTAFSDGDPIMKGADIIFRRQIPGAKGQPHTTIKGAGHFLQEDKGEELANIFINAFKSK